MKKEVYHMETAAIGGHAPARHNLGCYEVQNGTTERAVKHFLISANLGYDRSVGAIRELHTRGSVSKEVYATALRAYQEMQQRVHRGRRGKRHKQELDSILPLTIIVAEREYEDKILTN